MDFVVRTVAVFMLLISTVGATAEESLLGCDDPARDILSGASCSLSWVEHQILQRLVWSSETEASDMGVFKDVDGRYQVHSQSRPYLMDVDQDGWTDLYFFTPNSMVNGDYTFYRFEPAQDTFVAMGDVSGFGFDLDKNGFVVAVSRSGCCENEISFHLIEDHTLNLQFLMRVRSSELFDQAEQCQMYPRPGGPVLDTLWSDYPAMVADYCNFYTENGREKIRARSLDHDDLSAAVYMVPENTIFYCQLEDAAHEVTVTYRDGIYTYKYGLIGQDPDLEMRREASEVQVLPDNGAGSSRFGYVKFQNGGYTYQVHYGYGIVLGENSADVTETIRGLTVQRGDETAYVFDKVCLTKTSFDQIFYLE